MKIFYFSGTKLPSQNPISVHVMKMAQAFSLAGHDVTVFAKSLNNAASEDIFKIYDTQPCFKLHLSSNINIPLLSTAKKLVSLSRQISKLGKPDIIYGHDPVALALLTPEGTQIIYEAHNVPRFSTHRMAISKLIRNPNLKCIIAASDVLKQEFLRVYPSIDSEQIFVAHDGADLAQSINQDNAFVQLKGRDDSYNVGYAGALHPGKGIALITRLAKIRPNYDFHILGGTQKQVEMHRNNNTLRNLYFYGHRDHAEVIAYLKVFDVCVAPYQHRALIKTGRNTTRWISPMKIFEYMAAKNPIICSNLPVMHEILDHNKNAIIVSASNEEKWAQALDMLKDNPDIAEKIALNAFNSLEEKYTWDKRANAVLEYALSTRSPMLFASRTG